MPGAALRALCTQRGFRQQNPRLNPKMIKTDKPLSQPEKFRELARELGADESEAAFKAKLVKVAKAPRLTTTKGQPKN
jgi:hypothetical protein